MIAASSVTHVAMAGVSHMVGPRTTLREKFCTQGGVQDEILGGCSPCPFPSPFLLPPPHTFSPLPTLLFPLPASDTLLPRLHYTLPSLRARVSPRESF
jgi:hypothetical protein